MKKIINKNNNLIKYYLYISLQITPNSTPEANKDSLDHA